MKKKNVIITTLAVSLGIAATVAIVVPIVLTANNTSNQQSQVSSIRTTNAFDEFIATLQGDLIQMNAEINENRASWIRWVEPLNNEGAVVDGAILDVNSVRILIAQTASEPMTMSFGIDWNENYNISSDVAAQTIILNPKLVNISWGQVDPHTVVQEIISETNVYENIGAITASVNTAENKARIKALVNFPEVIEELNFTVTGTGPLTYILETEATYKEGYIVSGELTDILDLSATVASNLDWDDLNAAKTRIQELINTKNSYTNISAVADYLNTNDNKQIIKELTNNQTAIKELTVSIEGTNSKNFAISFVIEYNNGFSGALTLPNITGLTANIPSSIVWKESIDITREKIQQIIISGEGIVDREPIERLLNSDTYKPRMLALINDSDRAIQDIAVVVSGTNHDYTITINVTPKPGFTIASALPPIIGVEAPVTASINWKGTYRNDFQTFINTRGPYVSLQAMQELIDENHELIKNLTDNPSQIGTIVATVSYPTELSNSYSVAVAIATYAPGYVGSVLLDNIIGEIPSNWTDITQATTSVQNLINEGSGFYNNLDEVKTKLIAKKDEILAQIGNSERIQMIENVEFIREDSNKYFVIFTIKYNGAIGSSKIFLTDIAINLNQVVQPAWTANATETIQTLINQNSYDEATAATEIQNHLSTALNVTKIKELTTNSEQINATSVQVTKVDTKFSVLVSITDYNLGFTGTNKLAIIENLTANFNVSYSVNQTEATTLTQDIAANTSITNLESLNSWLANSAQADTLKTLIDATPPSGLASVSASAELTNNNWVITLNPTHTTGYTNIAPTTLTISVAVKI